jgi:hypothetical protein
MKVTRWYLHKHHIWSHFSKFPSIAAMINRVIDNLNCCFLIFLIESSLLTCLSWWDWYMKEICSAVFIFSSTPPCIYKFSFTPGSAAIADMDERSENLALLLWEHLGSATSASAWQLGWRLTTLCASRSTSLRRSLPLTPGCVDVMFINICPCYLLHIFIWWYNSYTFPVGFVWWELVLTCLDWNTVYRSTCHCHLHRLHDPKVSGCISQFFFLPNRIALVNLEFCHDRYHVSFYT